MWPPTPCPRPPRSQALPEDGRLVACDRDAVAMEVAKRYWRDARVDHKVAVAGGRGAAPSARRLGAPPGCSVLRPQPPVALLGSTRPCGAPTHQPPHDPLPRPPRPLHPRPRTRQVDARVGPALDSLRQLLASEGKGSFDFAFIDADKRGYRDYYELCLELVRPGGLVAVDNVLWYGKVADQEVGVGPVVRGRAAAGRGRGGAVRIEVTGGAFGVARGSGPGC